MAYVDYNPYAAPRKPIKRWTRMDEAMLRSKQKEYDQLVNDIAPGEQLHAPQLQKDISYYRRKKNKYVKERVTKMKHNRSYKEDQATKWADAIHKGNFDKANKIIGRDNENRGMYQRSKKKTNKKKITKKKPVKKKSKNKKPRVVARKYEVEVTEVYGRKNKKNKKKKGKKALRDIKNIKKKERKKFGKR